jgi:hypothetical protein
MSYGADVDDDCNNNKLFGKEHRKVIRKYGTIRGIVHWLI